MKRPPNDAWFDTQRCGPLFVMFTVHEYEIEGMVVVEWCICPDDDDKSDERAISGSDGDIKGPKDQIDALNNIPASMVGRESAMVLHRLEQLRQVSVDPEIA